MHVFVAWGLVIRDTQVTQNSMRGKDKKKTFKKIKEYLKLSEEKVMRTNNTPQRGTAADWLGLWTDTKHGGSSFSLYMVTHSNPRHISVARCLVLPEAYNHGKVYESACRSAICAGSIIIWIFWLNLLPQIADTCSTMIRHLFSTAKQKRSSKVTNTRQHESRDTFNSQWYVPTVNKYPSILI